MVINREVWIKKNCCAVPQNKLGLGQETDDNLIKATIFKKKTTMKTGFLVGLEVTKF